MINTIETLELRIARLLRIGVIIAGLLMLVGWLLQVKLNGNPFFNFQTYDEIPLLDLFDFHFRTRQWGPLITYAGLIVLISLPLIRVILTTYLFLRQKEYHLALIAFVVMVGLIVSMGLGIGH
ncbi:MAG: DUF1634 domain-containing protein [Bacteriovoracia bacterium]